MTDERDTNMSDEIRLGGPALLQYLMRRFEMSEDEARATAQHLEQRAETDYGFAAEYTRLRAAMEVGGHNWFASVLVRLPTGWTLWRVESQYRWIQDLRGGA